VEVCATIVQALLLVAAAVGGFFLLVAAELLVHYPCHPAHVKNRPRTRAVGEKK